MLTSPHITSSCISCLYVYLRTSDVTLTHMYVYERPRTMNKGFLSRTPTLNVSNYTAHRFGSNTCVVAALIYYR